MYLLQQRGTLILVKLAGRRALLFRCLCKSLFFIWMSRLAAWCHRVV